MTGQKNRFSTTEKLWNLDDKQLKSPAHDAMVSWLLDSNNAKQILKPLMSCNVKNGFLSKKFDKDDIITNTIDIDSEVPLYSSRTFIGGYADFLITWKFSICIENYPCSIDSKWADLVEQTYWLRDMDILLQKYWNDKNYNMKQHCKKSSYYYGNGNGSTHSSIRWTSVSAKYVDFMCNIKEDYPCSESDIEEWIRSNNFYHKYKIGYLKCLIEVKPYIDSFGAVLRQIKTYSSFCHNTLYNDAICCIFTLDDRFDKQFESQGIKVLHPPEDVTIDDMRDMYDLW